MCKKTKDYKVVEELTNTGLLIGCIAFIIIILTGLLNYFKVIESFTPFLLFFILFAYQIYRKRKCPICGKVMQTDYSKGFIPQYHYCSVDKVKIDSKIEASSS